MEIQSNNDSFCTIPLDLTYSSEDFKLISKGFTPRSMDDRWIISVNNGHIYISRSWTQTLIYDCSYEQSEKGTCITSMRVDRNRIVSDAFDAGVVKSLFERYIFGRMD